MTPQAHIDLVEKLDFHLLTLNSVKNTCINDFGRFSNFDLWVERKKGANFKEVIKTVNEFCKSNGMMLRDAH